MVGFEIFRSPEVLEMADLQQNQFKKIRYCSIKTTNKKDVKKYIGAPPDIFLNLVESVG